MVRIATSGMYYPGTMERAVLVAGDVDGVKVSAATTTTTTTTNTVVVVVVADDV